MDPTSLRNFVQSNRRNNRATQPTRPKMAPISKLSTLVVGRRLSQFLDEHLQQIGMTKFASQGTAGNLYGRMVRCSEKVRTTVSVDFVGRSDRIDGDPCALNRSPITTAGDPLYVRRRRGEEGRARVVWGSVHGRGPMLIELL
jgi:hypothetical protein